MKNVTPRWPQMVRAPVGAPNVLLILLDDVGFADTSTFGGLAKTPELDKFARQGIRYNNFHTTGLCSPTRASLLTGRNHHRVGFGGLTNLAAGYPGYDAIWKTSTVSFPEVLRRGGYQCAAFGKWHNTPAWEISPLGPFDRWPTKLGFDYFYGFNSRGEDSQWEPTNLFRNTTAVDPPALPEGGYHLTTDITDEAIRWLNTHYSLAPTKPYLLYFATGALHYPHHVARKWIEKYGGVFDKGWDELNQEIFVRQKELGVIPPHAARTARPAEIPEWKSLSLSQKYLYTRQMEVYAGFIEHTDYEVGRLLRAVEATEDADNTLIIYIVGDNGTSAEAGINGSTNFMTSVEDQLKQREELGGPAVGTNMYSAGWAWLGSTPFKWWKGVPSHFGGARNPMLVSWPAKITDGGGLRTQFTHVNDVAATIFEATGVRCPDEVDGIEQQPLDGVEFYNTFSNPNAPAKHRIQYFEIFGNRAIYRDGWVAAAAHAVRGWEWGERNPNISFEGDRWELYHVAEDFSEAFDLAEQHPGQLKELQELFEVEARRNSVYPLGAVAASFYNQPSLGVSKQKVVLYSGIPRLQMRAVPILSGRSFRITAHASLGERPMGVIMSYGGRTSGFVFYLRADGCLCYENVLRSGVREVIASEAVVPQGARQLAFEYRQERVGSRENWLSVTPGMGMGRLFIDGLVCGQAVITDELMFAGPGSIGVGRAFASPVSDTYQLPARFKGTLEKVIVEVDEIQHL